MLTGGIYDENGEMYWWCRAHPMMNFSRIVYKLSDNCAWRECTLSFNYADSETLKCLKCLYISSFTFFLLAIYFEEVIPQKYGIAKHPCFFLEQTFKKYFPWLYQQVFTNQADLVASICIDSELNDEDEDAKEERQTVYGLKK